MLGKGVPWNVPFFFARRKIITRSFSEQTQFWAKKCVLRSLSDKKPNFYRNFGRAWKIEEKTEKNDTSRLVRTALLPFFWCKRSTFREGSELKNDISKTRCDNWSLQSSDETLRNPIFLENQDSRPHYRTHRWPPLSNPWIEKSGPIIEAYSIYIYIYICMPESYSFVHLLAFLKVIRLSTVLSKSHFYSSQKQIKSY